MLHVDRCRDMDELITFEPEPDCFLRYRISAATRNFTSGKSDVYVLAAAARRGFTMVSFTEAVSRRKILVSEVHALHRVPF